MSLTIALFDSVDFVATSVLIEKTRKASETLRVPNNLKEKQKAMRYFDFHLHSNPLRNLFFQ